MPDAVLLLHTTPDGGSHFDWMIERPELDRQHCLMTWRCPSRPDDVRWDGACTQIQPHRIEYLGYEGELSGDRGRVQRVASGRVERYHEDGKQIEIHIQWADRRCVYLGQAQDDDGRWVFALR